MSRADIIGALPGFIAPALIYLGVITANRMQRGTQREVQVIGDLNARVEKAEANAAEAGKRVEKIEARGRLRDNYIHELRDHISKGQPPPPPPWPEGLTT
jgi:hypothetical protein